MVQNCNYFFTNLNSLDQGSQLTGWHQFYLSTWEYIQDSEFNVLTHACGSFRYLLELDWLIEARAQWWPTASDGKMVAVQEFPWHISDKGSLEGSKGYK